MGTRPDAAARDHGFEADLPAGVDEVASKAMAKEPSDRYGTAGELAEALAATSPREVPRSPTAPASRPADGRTGPATRRPRRGLTVALGAIVPVALVVGTIVALGRNGPPAVRPTSGPSSPPIFSSSGLGFGLYHLDAATGQVLGRVGGGGDTFAPTRVFGVALAAGFVWTIDPSHVRKVNPETNRQVYDITFVSGVFDIQAGEEAVWVQRYEGDEVVVYRIDPQTNQKLRVPGASLRARPGATSFNTAIAVADGSLWLADLYRATVVRIDSTTFERSWFDIPKGSTGIAVADGQVWVWDNGLDASVTRLDPASGAEIKRIDLPGGADGLAIGGGFTFVADSPNDTIVQIDTLKIRRPTPSGSGTPLETWHSATGSCGW